MLDLTEFAKPRTSTSIFQLVSTLALFVALWWLMALCADRSLLLTLLLAVPCAGVLLRTSLFQHDCGHHSFFRSRTANDVVGTLLGVFSFTPYFYWAKTHAMHHVNSSRMEGRDDLGSITTLTVEEYRALPKKERRAYRIFRHPLFLCGFGGPFQFLVKHRFPWDTPRSWRREWMSVFITDVGIAATTWLLVQAVGWRTFLIVELPVVIMASWGAVWLIYIQHVFPHGYFASGDAWRFDEASLRGSSFYALPRVLQWFTCNVGFHHVHHYCPRIPNYRLEECMKATPELQAVPKLRLRESLSCWSLKLWNGERQAFEGFPADD